MNNNIYCRYAGTTNKKSPGFSIAYAIVALVVVGVVLAGLTPVLTRKLPNLSTSSIIKNPKGWYESFNAPISGKYCSKCKEEDEKYNDCLKEKEKNPKSNKECKDPWPDITIKYDKTITTKDQCFGNPACIPYINPKYPSEIVPFEQYCKSNGKCNPDPDILKDVNEKLCHDANYTITGKLKSKLKPCPCRDGQCKFKPQSGITKYEVYAIGGGGGSGSAVASDPSMPDGKNKNATYKSSVTGTATTRLPYGNTVKEIINPTKNDNTGNTIDIKKEITRGKLSTEYFPQADFIDQSRTETDGNPYKPSDFPNNKKSQHANYPNILGDLDTNCATGIIYTIGKEDNNFHTYPTEDSNSVLAKSSTRQVKKIVGNRTYKIGLRSVLYYDRYYLYTRYLGAYAYNQNPVYLLMPEWVKVDDKDKRYPNDDNNIDKGYELTDKEGITRETINCSKDNKEKCDIANFPNNKNGTGGSVVDSILKTYGSTAGVVCSGNGGAGGDVEAFLKSGDSPCDWMKPNGCKFELSKNFTYDNISGVNDPTNNGYTGNQDIPIYKKCGQEGEPEANGSFEEFQYCKIEDETYKSDETKTASDMRRCKYDDLYYNRKCTYQETSNKYVTCTCESRDLNPKCTTNDDIKDECDLKPSKIIFDPNSAKDMRLFSKSISENDKASCSAEYTIETKDGKGNTVATKDGTANTNGAKHLEMDGAGVTAVTNQVEASAKEQDAIAKDIAKNTTTKITLESISECEGGTPECKMNTRYQRKAFGGPYGHGVCAYTKKEISRGAKIINIANDKNKDTIGFTYRTENKPKAGFISKNTTGGVTGTKGDNASPITVCINFNDSINNGNCVTASGGEGGTGGIIHGLCSASSENGKRGKTGGVSGNGSSFPNSEQFSSNALPNYGTSKTNNQPSDDKYKQKEDYYTQNGGKISGTHHYPGMYNYRYIWYMPFVTKHLMFGLAGEGGEEVHSLVTLSEGQTLDVTPGKGAVKTEYKSGANGGNGGQSEVRNDDAKVKIIAHGGKGGLGSQKTDEYVLCHISDLQNQNPNLPCYYTKDKNDFKSTHAREKDGKFVGILATQPKISTIVNSIKMSANLKDGTPGMGAMGFGTKSVSDVICEKRYVTKWDRVNKEIQGHEQDLPYGKEILSSGGTLYNVCRGNSKIKYIIPNGSKYTAGTGAVIIIW